RRRLAVFCDVFCEEGVFSVEESRRILTAARDAGLKLRLHADELAPTGGAELAAELRARSADHLLFVSARGMRALAETGCAATLLPAAAFYPPLGRSAPARALAAAAGAWGVQGGREGTVVVRRAKCLTEIDRGASTRCRSCRCNGSSSGTRARGSCRRSRRCGSSRSRSKRASSSACWAPTAPARAR